MEVSFSGVKCHKQDKNKKNCNRNVVKDEEYFLFLIPYGTHILKQCFISSTSTIIGCSSTALYFKVELEMGFGILSSCTKDKFKYSYRSILTILRRSGAE